MNTENITKAWKVLEDKGWSDLIDKKWKKDVIKDLKDGIPGITQSEIDEILSVCIW
jgi:hypothetical protein